MERKTAQTALAMLEEGHTLSPSPEVMKELFRVWLAVDSAPEARVYDEYSHYGVTSEDDPAEAIAPLLGRTVRLVPLATAKGEK